MRRFPAGPQLRAAGFHPDVWASAESLWRSGHFQEAVAAAARAVNARLQARVDRRDVSETKLVQEAFTSKRPEPNKARLRLPGDRESDTWKSQQEGVLSFGVGCFRAIRNRLAHEATAASEPDEHLALEQLAAWSLFRPRGGQRRRRARHNPA